MTVIAIALFSVMILSGLVAYLVLLSYPNFSNSLQSMLSNTGGYMAIPPPYTNGLYRFIFLNNIAHFWNPVRLWVWIPLVGAFGLGYELILNTVVIGGVASFVSLTKGPLYTVEGLVPHGVIEIPAFILEFTGLARWHVAATPRNIRKIEWEKNRPPTTQRRSEGRDSAIAVVSGAFRYCGVH